MQKKLKLKGRKLFTEDGKLYAEIEGCRSRDVSRGRSRPNISIHYASGRKDHGYCYFHDAVNGVRGAYMDEQS